jgi:hypothetical protein
MGRGGASYAHCDPTNCPFTNYKPVGGVFHVDAVRLTRLPFIQARTTQMMGVY